MFGRRRGPFAFRTASVKVHPTESSSDRKFIRPRLKSSSVKVHPVKVHPVKVHPVKVHPYHLRKVHPKKFIQQKFIRPPSKSSSEKVHPVKVHPVKVHPYHLRKVHPTKKFIHKSSSVPKTGSLIPSRGNNSREPLRCRVNDGPSLVDRPSSTTAH